MSHIKAQIMAKLEEHECQNCGTEIEQEDELCEDCASWESVEDLKDADFAWRCSAGLA